MRVRGEEMMLAMLGGGIGLWFALVLFLHLAPLYGALSSSRR